MDLFQAFVLGIVQGATEYIPVSSSAHLILVPWLLAWPDASFAFEVLVQWGTLVGVFIFFWPDIWAIARGVLQGLRQGEPVATFEAKLGWLVIASTIPAVFLGVLFKDFFEAAFAAPIFAGGLLILTALLLIMAERYGSRRHLPQPHQPAAGDRRLAVLDRLAIGRVGDHGEEGGGAGVAGDEAVVPVRFGRADQPDFEAAAPAGGVAGPGEHRRGPASGSAGVQQGCSHPFSNPLFRNSHEINILTPFST